jgi:hypothetical protein
MSNPFSRLKHFTFDKSDPQENHATECLAACLVFSNDLRNDFITFLFEGRIPDEVKPYLDDVELTTQDTLGSSGEFGRADMLLSSANHFNLLVEVKVKAAEDGKQLEGYWKWLRIKEQQNNELPFLFTLVKNPNDSFQFSKHNVRQRFTWHALHGRIKKFGEQANHDPTASLASNFCEYLETEGIVSTYTIEDIQYYGPGLKAQKAVISILNQVGERLKAEGYDYSVIPSSPDGWPRLQFKHPDWDKLFGMGDNHKVWLWFTVPPVWGAEKHTFYPELLLWHEDQNNDWSQLKTKIPQWATELQQHHGFEIWRQDHWKKDSRLLGKGDMSVLESGSIWRIYATREGADSVMEGKAVLDENTLVTKLLNQATEFAKILSSLP